MPYRTPAFQDWANILGLFFFLFLGGDVFFHFLVFPRAVRKRSLGCSGLQLPAQGPVYVEDALRSGDTLIPRESARCGSIRDLPSFCRSRGRQQQLLALLALHSCSRTIFFSGCSCSVQCFVVVSGFPEGAEYMSNTSRATPSSIVNGLWICCFSLSPDMVLVSFLVYVCVRDYW